MRIRQEAKGARGDAYAAVRLIYEKSPGRSWTRLNGALSGVLHDAITAMLSFKEDDFKAMCDEMNGGYWMGDGAGSHLGERFYGHAVEIGHQAACISFEKWAGRPAALWAERVKTPVRLCVGSDFTWEGVRVRVTSMKEDRLIACTYKNGATRSSFKELQVNGIVYAGAAKYRRIDEVKTLENGDTILRLGMVVEDTDKVDRRFTITYEELKAKRKEFDTRRKAAVKLIEEAETAKALEAVLTKLNGEMNDKTYRHFDIEEIHAAVGAKRKEFKDAENRKAQEAAEGERLQQWLAGQDVPSYFSSLKVRIRGTYVETTNGQHASVESVKKVLPIILKRRSKFGAIRGLEVDFHEVRRLSREGVQVGCTVVPWSEVDRLKTLLDVGQAEA